MAGVVPFVPNDPEQSLEITLEGFRYVLRARWNTRDESWYLDIFDASGNTPIVTSLRLVLGVRIAERELGGTIILVDTSRTGIEARLEDLGTRVEVWYLSPEDIYRAQFPLATGATT